MRPAGGEDRWILAAHRRTANAAGIDWKSAVHRRVAEEVSARWSRERSCCFSPALEPVWVHQPSEIYRRLQEDATIAGGMRVEKPMGERLGFPEKCLRVQRPIGYSQVLVIEQILAVS